MDRLYCTLRELCEDLHLPGVKSEAGLMKHIRAASQFIDARKQFMPQLETRKFRGRGGTELLIPALLSVTTIMNDGVELTVGTDFVLWPDQRHWVHGPYSAVMIPSSGSQIGSWSTLKDGVVITGNWGLYEETEDLDANVTTADGTSTTLTVIDGGKVSPGMVLLVESEQILVEETGAASDSTATLGEDLDDTETTVTVNSGALLHVGETIKIGFEEMLVEDISGNDLEVARGYNETARTAHTTGAAVSVYRAFRIRRGVNGTTGAAHSNAAVYRYRAPEDVNYLCRQIAALMLKKAETGYIGRSGNDDLGTGFWVNEFPKNQIDAVLGNYNWGGR